MRGYNFFSSKLVILAHFCQEFLNIKNGNIASEIASVSSCMDMAKINQYYDTVLFSVYEVGFLRKFRVEGEH